MEPPVKRSFVGVITESEDKCRVMLHDLDRGEARYYEAPVGVFETVYKATVRQVIMQKLYFELSGDTMTDCPSCEGSWYVVDLEHEPPVMQLCKSTDCLASYSRYFEWWDKHVFSDLVSITFEDKRGETYEI